MTIATILPTARTVFLDTNNNPLVGGSVYFYVPPNTTTPKTTWQDANGSVSNTNPVILDGNGSALIYGSGQYLQKVYDFLGNLIYSGLTQDTYGLLVGGNNTFTGTNIFQGTTTFTGTTNLPSSAITTLSGNFPTFKNRVLNGDARIDQANEGASVTLATTVASFICDGLVAKFTSSDAAASAQQVAGTSTAFSKALKITIGTGSAAVGSSDFLIVQSSIEGYNFADFLYGGSTASLGSLSFWVNSSITGTFSYCLRNSANNRTYVNTFTIGAANSWTQILVPAIVGDITGTWLTTNGVGLQLVVTIAAGATLQTGTLAQWQAGAFIAASTQTNTILTTSSATFQCTGLQWEKNSVCTNFDYREYDKELIFAQRYYQKSFSPGTKPVQSAGVTDAEAVISNASSTFGKSMPLKVTMRAVPSIVTFNPSAGNANWRDSTNSADRTVTVGTIGQNSFVVTGASGVASATNVIHYTADARL